MAAKGHCNFYHVPTKPLCHAEHDHKRDHHYATRHGLDHFTRKSTAYKQLLNVSWKVIIHQKYVYFPTIVRVLFIWQLD